MGTQLGKAIATDYYNKGGKFSGALGILDKIIKDRETERASKQKMSETILGAPGVAEGIAEQAGLPVKPNLLDVQRTQNIEGTSPSDAKTLAWREKTLLEKELAENRFALQKIDLASYLKQKKAKLGSSYDNLPAADKVMFDDYVTDIWTRAQKPGKVSKDKPSKSKYTITPLE